MRKLQFPGLPDFRSLDIQLRLGAILTVASFGLLWIVAAWQLEERGYREASGARLRAMAQSIAVFGEGDSHAGLGTEPNARLGDLAALLGQLHERSESTDRLRTARTLRIRPEARERIEANPDIVHTGALEVVVQSTFDENPRRESDYMPCMADALLNGETLTLVVEPEEGQTWSPYVAAFSPIRDSWGEVTAVAEVTMPFEPGVLRTLLKGLLSAGLAGAVGFLSLRVSFHFIGRVSHSIRTATARATSLSAGIRQPLAQPRHTTLEHQRLFEALDGIEAAHAEGLGLKAPEPEAPPPPAPAPAVAGVAEPEKHPTQDLSPAPEVTFPEASVAFELPLFVRQIIDSGRQRAAQRQIDLQVLFGDNVPSHVIGKPEGLYQGLTALLKNAFSLTQGGSIVLRIARVPDMANVVILRFEVADTGSGIPWKEQPELESRLQQAAQADPEKLREPVLRAAALARQLGGELGFESQPGSGSRFWFTACFEATQAPVAT